MKTILLLFFLFTSLAISQEKFTFNEDGTLEREVKYDVDLSKEEIYAKALDWIKLNYNSPDQVIISKSDNNFIRFNGYKPALATYRKLGVVVPYDLFYTIKFETKDLKYRLTIEEFAMTKGGKSIEYLQIKGGKKLKETLQDYKDNCIIELNKLSTSLNQYINGIHSDDQW